MKLLLLITVGLLSAAPINKNPAEIIRSDETLIIPGIGGERIVMGMNISDVISQNGCPEKIADFREGKELFEHIFKIDSPKKIRFDKIFYYKSNNYIVFFRNQMVSAVIGLNTNRITNEFVSLNSGVEYFIFCYGNSGLDLLKKDRNLIYIYSKFGIAIVDDNGDDKIDMYMVFPIEQP
jgi:hypothetical protein